MIAIPLSQEDSTQLNKDFTNAPYFALMDTISGNFRTVKNNNDVLDIFNNNNVESTIAYEKEDVLQSLDKTSVEVYSSFKSQLTLEEIYRKALSNKFKKMYN